MHSNWRFELLKRQQLQTAFVAGKVFVVHGRSTKSGIIESSRGAGTVLFGADITKSFLERNSLELCIW